MITIKLQIMSSDGDILCENIGKNAVTMIYRGVYQKGDRICLSTEPEGIDLIIRLDNVLGPAQVYLKSDFEYVIPFGEQRMNLPNEAFCGDIHYLYVEALAPDMVFYYKNLSLNPYDIQGNSGIYPHASANIETRGESVFAARNAIDGILANKGHGLWPYTSWGIDRRSDAEFYLDFGRTVEINRLVFYMRADFPHDNWWKQITICFSDGESMICCFEKSEMPQIVCFKSKCVTGLTLRELIKSDEPSPFPALTQIEVYGIPVNKEL